MASLAGEATPQCKAIRKHFADLLIAIQDPAVLAAELYAADIIVRTLLESVRDTPTIRTDKTSKLLGAVSDHVSLKPDDFETFLGILRSKTPLMGIVKELEASYHSCKLWTFSLGVG